MNSKYYQSPLGYRTPLIKEVTAIDYHRNGVGGAPFYIANFTDHEGNAFTAMIFSYMPKDRHLNQVGVIKAQMAAEGNIAFGENSWRGDTYASQLYKAIDAYCAEQGYSLEEE